MISGTRWTEEEAVVVAQEMIASGDRVRAWELYRSRFPDSQRTYDSISDALRPGRTVANYIEKLSSGTYQPDTEFDPRDSFEVEALLKAPHIRDQPDGSKVTTVTGVSTEAELRKACNLPEDEWLCLYIKPKAWQVACKDEDTMSMVATQLVGVEAKFVPFGEVKALQRAKDAIFAMLAERDARAVPRVRATKVIDPDDEILAVVNIYDVHLQSLCWAAEVGMDYDLDIAIRDVRNAMADLRDQMLHRRVDRILFVIGNDFFHTDRTDEGKGGVTSRGTKQDVDSRWQKAFVYGLELLLDIIEEFLLPIADVELIVVPGNHDTQKAWLLGQCLKMAFRKDERVAIDDGPASRKYYRWGKCLFGMAHGHNEKLPRLATLMAKAAKADWGQTTWHTWFLGHLHREMLIQEEHGVVIHFMPAIAATDAWHDEKGFTDNNRGANVLFYSKTRGYRGQASHVIPPQPGFNDRRMLGEE